MRFIALEQYPDSGAASKSDRANAGMPSLVVDQCNPCANQIINDWIRNRMGIQIGPGDSAASEATAKVFNGYARNLVYMTFGRRHGDQAFRNLVRGGRGYFGLMTRRRPGTFKQELYFRGFPDSQAVYMDPYAQELDLTDNNVSFVRQVVSKQSFKAENPGKDFDCDFADWDADYADWVTKDGGGVVAEYWKAKWIPRKLQKLTRKIPIQRGSAQVVTDEVYSDEYDKLPEGVDVANDPSDGGARMEEDEPKRVIIFRKITGKNILQETEWVGKIIPIVPMVAKSIIVEGKKRIFSAISGGLDPQCQVNYAESNIAAEMGSETYVPWVGAVGQFKTQRQAWQDLNIVRRAFIEYDPVVAGGKIAPPPTKPNHEPQIMAFAHASDRAQQNFRIATGLNKSSLGIEDGRAISGVAKKALISEGDTNTFDFPDAGANAWQLAGDIIVDVWPKIATEAEVIQILDDQEKQQSVLINADPKTFAGAPKDQVDIHMLDQGNYKVRVSAEPSAQTMREQTEDALQELFKELPEPQKVMIAAPLVREMTFNGKDGIAERLELPEYKKPADGAPNIPPEAQAAITAAGQYKQAAEAHIANLEQQISTKQAELDTRLKMNQNDNETRVAVAEISKGIAAFQQEVATVHKMLGVITDHLKIQQDAASQKSAQQHAAEMQQGQQDHATQLQESAQAVEPQNGNGQ